LEKLIIEIGELNGKNGRQLLNVARIIPARYSVNADRITLANVMVIKF